MKKILLFLSILSSSFLLAADAEQALEAVDADYFATNDYATVNQKTTEQFNKLSQNRQISCQELLPCFLEHSTCCSPRIICGECREARSENCMRPGQCVVLFKNCSNKDLHAQDIFAIEAKCYSQARGNDYFEIIALKKISLEAGAAPVLSNALQAHLYVHSPRTKDLDFGYYVSRTCSVGDNSLLELLVGNRVNPLSSEERLQITKLLLGKTFAIGESILWGEHNLSVITIHPFVMKDEKGNEYTVNLRSDGCVVDIPQHWIPNQGHMMVSHQIFSSNQAIAKPNSFNPHDEFFLAPNIAVISVLQIQNLEYLKKFNGYCYDSTKNPELIYAFFGSLNVVPRDLSVHRSKLDRFGGVNYMKFEDTFEKSAHDAYELRNHLGKQILVMSIKYFSPLFVDDSEDLIMNAEAVAQIFSTCNNDLLIIKNSDSTRSYFVRNQNQIMPTYIIQYREIRE
jgi:hypothetical protein